MVRRRVIKIGLSASALVDVVHGVAVPFILCQYDCLCLAQILMRGGVGGIFLDRKNSGTGGSG